MKRFIYQPSQKEDVPPLVIPLSVPRGKHRGQNPGAFGNKRRNNQLVAKPLEMRRVS